MNDLWRRWNNISFMAGLLWWAIILPPDRFHGRLYGFCRTIVDRTAIEKPPAN